jgi:hypothetical protein
MLDDTEPPPLAEHPVHGGRPATDRAPAAAGQGPPPPAERSTV